MIFMVQVEWGRGQVNSRLIIPHLCSSVSKNGAQPGERFFLPKTQIMNHHRGRGFSQTFFNCIFQSDAQTLMLFTCLNNKLKQNCLDNNNNNNSINNKMNNNNNGVPKKCQLDFNWQ